MDENKTVTDVAVEKELLEELSAKVSENVAQKMRNLYLSGASNDELSATNKKAKQYVEFFKTLNEGTGSAGGFLVPDEFEKSVIKYTDQYSQLRSLSTVVQMNSDQKRLNTIATEPTVYIVGENTVITPSDPVFGEPVLTAKKYAGITSWTSELEEDSEVVGLVELLAERFGRQIAKKEQQEFISGTTAGSEGFLVVSGVTVEAMAAGDTTYDKITWDHLANMIALLEEVDMNDAAEATFVMSPSVFNVLRKRKASGSGEYFVLPAPQNGVVAQAWGRPVVLVNEMPKTSDSNQNNKKFVALANWRLHSFIGDRRGITVSVSDSGVVGTSSAFERDIRLLRVTKRTAYVTALQNGIVCLRTANT